MNTNSRKNFIIVVLSWIIILLSINSGFYSVTNLFYNLHSLESFFINLINSLRWTLPLILLPIILKISFRKIHYNLFSLNLLFISFYYLVHLFIFHGNDLFQSLLFKGLIIEGPNLNSEKQMLHGPQLMDNINLLVCYITTILIFSYIYQQDKNKILIFKIIFFSFICLISIFIFYQIIIDLTKTESIFLYYNQALSPDTKYFDQPAPRITGWSRMILIIFMFYFFYNELKNIKKRSYLLNLIVLLFISILIIFSQTRGSLVGFFFLFLFYLCLPNINFSKKIIIIILFISIPFSLLSYVDSQKIGKYRADQNRMKITFENLLSTEKNKSKSLEHKNLINNNDIKENKYVYSVSSGRIETWTKSIEKLIKEKKIFGYGPQGDRYMLTLLAKSYMEAIWGNNSSNAIVYSSISGGIIGFISILLIYVSLFLLFLKCLKKIFINKTKDFFLISCFSIFCYIVMRSFFENGFTVFGIDFCILITSYYVLSSRISIINKGL